VVVSYQMRKGSAFVGTSSDLKMRFIREAFFQKRGLRGDAWEGDFIGDYAIELGHPGWLLTPLVLGPDMVPVVTDADTARENPELAVLSALTHGRHPDRYPVLDALIISLDIVDHEHASMYFDLVLAALPAAARRHLEEQMTTTREFKSDFMRNLVTTSEARGEARAVLTVLEALGIDVPADIRSRITGCTDPVVLDAWVRAAVTVTSVDELFSADD